MPYISNITPVLYKIRLTPDLENFRFDGNLELRLAAREPTDTVVLNVLELDIHSCRTEIKGSSAACEFRLDKQTEQLHIDLPQTVSGALTLWITYTGGINDRMAGFYRSRYRAGDKDHTIAVTQFQESDARRAFPCLDHPGKKAVFEIELVIDEDLTVLSNEIPEFEERLPGRKKGVRFQKTPKMSTYLVFWGIGEFQLKTHPEDPRVRVAYLPGMAPYTGFGMNFGKDALAFCEDFFGIPYPLSKMDLITVPDFAFGAMENWGAITFRENLLLDYPGVTSQAGRERIAEVISHEIVHQWFGNLATPSDWRFLWLNESFATYFGFNIVDHYHPEWETWPQFLYSQIAPALVRDGLPSTIPIEIPGGEHVVINTSTAPIIYCKGAGVLGQIRAYVGEAAFQQGLRQYLKTYAYDCAESRNLWESFEAAADLPLTEMMQDWVYQPGYPQVSARCEGRRLILRQERFSYLPKDDSHVWRIPVSILLRYEDSPWERREVLMEGKSLEVELDGPPAAYKVNAGQTGFYRVRYENPEDLKALGREIIEKFLSPDDRWGLVNDLYASVLAGSTSVDTYLAYLHNFRLETHFLPLAAIGDHLQQVGLFASKAMAETINAFGKEMAGRVLSAIGLEPQGNEPSITGQLRNQWIWLGVFWGDETIIRFARDGFAAYRTGRAVNPDILTALLKTGAYAGGLDVYEFLLGKLKTVDSEHERTQILSALGWFSDASLIQKVKEYVFAAVPARNQSVPVAAMAENPSARPGLWNWYTKNISEFQKFHPLIHERAFCGIVAVSLEVPAETIREFVTNQKIGINPDVLAMALERLAVHQRMNRIP